MTSPWLSALLGAGLGGSYGAAAYTMSRFALRHRRQRFMALFVGGMLLRMAGMLAAVGLTLAFVSVQPVPFALTLVVFIIAGLAFEVHALHQRA